MSRIFMIGDTHLALGFPNKSEKWLNTHKEYFNKFLFPLLRKEVKEGDIIIHLGDLFDNRNIIPIDILNFGLEIVEELSKIAPTHILVGNHDCYHKSSSEINTIRPFKHIPNIFIYEKTSTLEYNDVKLLMMPFIEEKKEQVRLLQANKNCDYVFCHSDLNGAKMHLTSVAHKNTDKIDVEEFISFKKVYSGHIHILQESKNFIFVGNNFQMDRNDMNTKKGIYMLDTDTGEETFFENKISPVFKEVYIRNQDDIENLDTISTTDYIDLFISNTLLVGNRKLRRKLELILETGNFASVEYIDDINKTTEKEDNKLMEGIENSMEVDEEGKTFNIKLEYKDVIREYITSQKYETEKIKNGILQEYNEVVTIYDSGLKTKK